MLYSRRQKSYELRTWRRAAYEVPCLSEMKEGTKFLDAKTVDGEVGLPPVDLRAVCLVRAIDAFRSKVQSRE